MYARSGPMLSSLLERLAHHAVPGRPRLRVVAEQALAARSPAQARAYMRYEAAANVAYRPFATSVLCPYDTARLPDSVLEQARASHPELVDGATAQPSDAFVDPRELVRRLSYVEPTPPDAVEVTLDGLDDISAARHRVAALARSAGLNTTKVSELEVAVSELSANAIVHGAPPRRISVYVHDGAFVCQIRDGGRGIADPLAGYLVPDTRSPGGRGLWIAHQLSDVVEAMSDETGSRICVRMAL
jgi:anti-sigma regulatory factor (Ser/Thr protein kinase)